MTTGPLILTDGMILRLVTREPAPLDVADLTAVLLSVHYTPDPAGHDTFGDIAAFEISAPDYARRRLFGGRFAAGEGGAAFHSDPLNFGDPVTFPPVRYLAFCFGTPMALPGASPLVGVMDLAPAGGAVEAVRSAFLIPPPPGGWFSLQRAA
jgi:hypothetical protein